MVPGDIFYSFLMLCYCVLHVLGHFVHWNCCIEEMRSLLEFEGRLARQRRFHLFNSWNLKEASQESFVVTCSTVGNWRTPRMKASLSHLQLLEIEGRLARKLQCHVFNCCLARKLNFLKTLMLRSSKLQLQTQYYCVLHLRVVGRIVMAAWKLRTVLWQQIFFILALMIFLFKLLLKSASKSSFFRFGVEIRFWSCKLLQFV